MCRAGWWGRLWDAGSETLQTFLKLGFSVFCGDSSQMSGPRGSFPRYSGSCPEAPGTRGSALKTLAKWGPWACECGAPPLWWTEGPGLGHPSALARSAERRAGHPNLLGASGTTASLQNMLPSIALSISLLWSGVSGELVPVSCGAGGTPERMLLGPVKFGIWV